MQKLCTCQHFALFDAVANLNAEDEDGDCCLHLALMRRGVAVYSDTSPHLASVRLIAEYL